MDDGGWKSSAKAWIADMGETGDFGRQYVLDGPMTARLRALPGGVALDVGCGEGRFCRILRAEGFEPVGLDPTEELLAAARAATLTAVTSRGGPRRWTFPTPASTWWSAASA
jgi:2-polyprenyl-3-methyl-5-hydroxy-6-metoxy-1,4-benzoquinol methylase